MPEPPPRAIEELVAIVSDLTGEPATFVEDLTFSNRAVVARLRLRAGTVIAKQPHGASAFAHEAEALRILPAPTRKALIASGRGTLVMEDLGNGPSLADLLLRGDPSAAEHGLLAWAKTLGTALAATLRFGEPVERTSLEYGLGELLELATALGVTAPPDLGTDTGLIEEALSADTAWLAYCPGDTCPDNNRVLNDGSLRLFDFEGAEWRHGATEAAYCRAPFCTCWCV